MTCHTDKATWTFAAAMMDFFAIGGHRKISISEMKALDVKDKTFFWMELERVGYVFA